MKHIKNIRHIFKQLLNEFPNSDESEWALGQWQEACKKKALEYMKDAYGADRDDINYDIIEIWSASTGTNSGGIKRDALRFGNLYSFVLACGQAIPYQEWVFDNQFTGYDAETDRTLIAEWNEETKIGTLRVKLQRGRKPFYRKKW